MAGAGVEAAATGSLGAGFARRGSRAWVMPKRRVRGMEATTGIEPVYTDLQSAA